MAKGSTKKREQNALEQWLLKLIDTWKNQREKILQWVLFLLVIIAGVLFIRYNHSRKDVGMGRLDDAYYQSSMADFFGGSSDLSGYAELAQAYKSGEVGTQARLILAEGKLREGQMDVMRKEMNSKAEYNNEEVSALDPAAAYSAALDLFNEVINKKMAKDSASFARAWFGVACAQEGLAPIAADDAAVESTLAQAKTSYANAKSAAPESAYAKIVDERLARLERPVTVAFYKQAADQYRNMPVPPAKPAEESILPNGPNENLDPSDTSSFDVLDEVAPPQDAAPAEESAPAEEAAPAEESAPTEESIPVSDAAPAE